MRLLDDAMYYALEVIDSFRESGYFVDLGLDENQFLNRVIEKCKKKILKGMDYHFSDDDITDLVKEGVQMVNDSMLLKFMEHGIVDVKIANDGEMIYVANDKAPKRD